ncbi:MAG: aminotransferase class I/II-fold pyridoxal phosphate-dependent enzyme [Lachnospiraceae bacterium]|nr:aminotransferase class I/II-fold pyridoxal phosphate-dependent enzyme [Lachnospiraceae bacterium]
MKSYSELTREELLELKSELEKKYEEAKAEGLALDMSRGKPSPAQLDLSRGMLDVLNSSSELKAENGTDVRNYGLLEGIYEARKLMGDIMGVPAENVIVCGNASLNIMYDLVSRAEVFGFDGCTPWAKLDKVKFLCPAPGYDRHFGITELFGIEMITVPMNEDGPDMDIVEKYVNNDESVKGIWCVPKYSNPQGVVYSDETVKRFAALKPAAKDFRVFWDNAYAVHDLYPEKEVKLLNIFDECKKNGNENMVFELCSTSKISFSGAGISAVASSKDNIEEIKKYMTKQTIGYDKINQLRHVRFFKDINGIKEHMKKHAALLRPKFEAVLDTLENDLAGTGVGTWTKPLGGYFISFEGLEGTAKAIVQKCKDAGMTLTGAGATYPYKNDPKDSNIRIAPSYPSLEEMSKAAALFTICVRLVSIDKILETK